MRPPRWAQAARDLALNAVGGPAQGRAVLMLAAVLGLNGADTATISATTGELERAFHIGNTQIGLLLSVVALTGAVFTVPAGILTDRAKRTRLLAISITGWAVAMLVSGAAQTYLWLVLARVGLGLMAAAAGPIVASLTGDYFPPGDRGRVYSLILGGELAGTGIGFLVSGDISSVLSWRYAIWWLVPLALALAWAVHRMPEPARGAQEQQPARDASAPPASDLAGATVRRAQVEPDPDLVLRSDPTGRSIWWAIRYVLRVRTNVVIIVASALGYFYFAGLRSFAIIFATGHYRLSKPVADSLVLVIGVGAVAGVFAGGRLADRLLRGGFINARVLIPAVCLLAIGPVLAPAIAATSLAVALPLLTAGALLLGAANPPMDAARLDIMPARLWGRAEGVRTVLRTLGEAAAPVLFGYVSQYVFGGSSATAGSAEAASGSGAGSSSGLESTFLVFLVPLALAGLLALLALRTYPRDVATAQASAAAIRRASQAGQPEGGGRLSLG
jgi:predicted MFS family arabinose efflux permease